MSRLTGENDGGRIMLIDKLMVSDIVLNKHSF